MSYNYRRFPGYGGYGYGYGYPYGGSVYNDIRLSNTLNEYAELNDLAAKNNAIYTRNLIEDAADCRSYMPTIPSVYSYPSYYPSYYPGIYPGRYPYFY